MKHQMLRKKGIYIFPKISVCVLGQITKENEICSFKISSSCFFALKILLTLMDSFCCFADLFTSG